MRTVFSVEALGGIDPATDAERLTVRVVRSPFNVDKARVAHQLTLTAEGLPEWGVPGGVRERGRGVRDSLIKHPGVATVLTQLFTTPVGQQQPIFVMLSESEAERICWETLCNSKDQFVALDPRWPIGRIIDPTTAPNRPPSELALPVRMMVLISAFGIKGQAKEWQMLRDGVFAARAKGLPIRVKVMVGDPEVRKMIDADIAGGLADVEVAPIEGTPMRMVREIVDWSPNILHCFCHGRSDPANQAIEFATAGDYADPETTEGKVKISVSQLEAISTQLQNPWLLVLNCCSSGQAAENLQSLAHRVVSAGFPAAVAMLEPVDANDAHEFTRAFYHSVFAGIGSAAKVLKNDRCVPFEWTNAMVAARTAINDLHNGDASNAREWALPVLYVRGVDPLLFERPLGVPEAEANIFKARARIVADWLKESGLRISEFERRVVMEQALDGVPKAFWPSPNGSFDNG
jgi:hypothetical protein